MDEVEWLKKRKELLELDLDVARLERKANRSKKIDKLSQWSWIGVLPLSVIGLFFVTVTILNINSTSFFEVIPVGIGGLILLIPAFAKIFGKR